MKAKAATPAQIAARKKFAERARSGELARMRKKNPAKKPTRAASRKANPDSNMFEIRHRTGIKSGNVVEKFNDIGLAKDYLDEIDKPIGTYYGYDVKNKKVFFSFAYDTKFPHAGIAATAETKRLRKSNPTATRAPERKRTKLITNGERKKNPRVRYADIAGPSVAEFKTVYAVHLAGQPSMNAMAYFTTKKNAVDTAQFLADETGKQVKVTRIQIAFN